MSDSSPLHISNLEIVNFKTLAEVTIAPRNKHIVRILGPNESGKTTIIDAAAACLLGKRSHPEVPIRIGSEDSTVKLTVADKLADRYQVTVSWRGDKSYFSVYELTADGPRKIAKPQTFIDTWTNELMLRPSKFLSEKPAEQLRILLDAFGLQESYMSLTGLRSARIDNRRDAKRKLQALTGQLALTPDPSPTETLVDTGSDEIKALIEQSNKQIAAGHELDKIKSNLETMCRNLAEAKNAVLAEERQLAIHKDAIIELDKRIQVSLSESIILEDKVPSKILDTGPTVAEQIQTLQSKNESARQQKLSRSLSGQVREVEKAVESFDDQIKAFNKSIVNLISDSDSLDSKKFAGIGVDPETNHITYRGLPLEQASGMRSLWLATLIITANSNVRLMDICIDEADCIDDANLKEFASRAAAQGYTTWFCGSRLPEMENECFVNLDSIEAPAIEQLDDLEL